MIGAPGSTPDEPEVPGAPEVPELPDVPDVPTAPGVPIDPEVPVLSDAPDEPELPDHAPSVGSLFVESPDGEALAQLNAATEASVASHGLLRTGLFALFV